jgi:hypothetical protein
MDAAAMSLELHGCGIHAVTSGRDGNTLAAPHAVVPARGVRRGSRGVFGYLVPANSLTVVRVAR